MNSFTLLFLLMFAIVTATQFWLTKRQAAYVLAHHDEVPEAFTKTISLAAHQKAADYKLAKSEGIFIMDGSKRSGHGNAYFTGLGNNKRIVFYDNLVASLDDEELEAVF